MSTTKETPVMSGDDDIFSDEAAEIEALEVEQGGKPSKQPEQKAAAETEDKGEQKPKADMVPHQALHQARQEAKRYREAEAAISRKYAEDMAKANARLEQILAAQTRQQEPEIPAFEDNPAAHLYTRQQQTEAQLRQFNEWKAQQDRAAQQQATLSRIQDEVTRLEQDYAQSVPEYYDAARFVMESWQKQAQAVGMTPQEMAAYVQQNAIGIANLAAQRGKNPAELTHELAKAAGFTKPQPKAETVSDKLATIQRGQQTSKSASTAPGTSQAPTGIESILAMDDEEFAAKYGDDRAWRKALRP